jgi:hypothetical protein
MIDKYYSADIGVWIGGYGGTCINNMAGWARQQHPAALSAFGCDGTYTYSSSALILIPGPTHLEG